ncbi:MAG: tetratricopeptide repeat protein [Bacteroidales bacterium]|nr:tetratricopeptide repeat protein [Bacteroidales bacterium]
MKTFKTIFYLVLVALIISACTSPKENKLSEIKLMEDELFSDESQMIDRQKANDLIGVYESFAEEFPNDTETPVYLFKAGDMAMNLNMPRKAIDIFDKILNNYPDFEKAPQCLFLKGYVYENDLKDLETAKKLYEEFLVKYPDDEFADDAEISIKNLGKSPEELIREFEEQQQKEGEI